MLRKINYLILWIIVLLVSCSKNIPEPGEEPIKPPTPTGFSFSSLTVNNVFNGFTYYNLNYSPTIKLTFSVPVNTTEIHNSITLMDAAGNNIIFNTTLENNETTLVIVPKITLQPITKYLLQVSTSLKSKTGGNLQSPLSINLITAVNDTDKFPRISDEELLTLVQKQTFKYFWDFGHPNSGLARERNSAGDIVTTGGSGFGVMALITGIHRNFITREQGLLRIQKMLNFLKNNAQRFHGAFPHWLDGNTGKVVPFSAKDNGADLVETSFLMQGLITARQYFNGTDASETKLRNDINSIYNEVEWSWFRQNNSNALYWHWSPNFNWDMNMQVKGWNECLITYIMAASSSSYPIPKAVYTQGWAGNGSMQNGNTFYNLPLPLGPAFGGPLFFAHYSFLGINPIGLSDPYANYETQNKNHTLINHNYCVANPKGFNGYSADCWGLTASDISTGYTASSPTNDLGFIAPTAALSSFPYTPIQSMQALKYFYYKLGDKIFKEYGFVDSFSLTEPWFATSTLAIDQGPIIIMIENHRSKLLWNLFMSAPEIKTGMRNLQFTSPNL